MTLKSASNSAIADPSGNSTISSAAKAWSSLLYSTTGGHAAKPTASKPAVAQPVNQLVAITRAASGRLQHPALDFIGLLRDFEMFSKPPRALTGAADRQQE